MRIIQSESVTRGWLNFCSRKHSRAFRKSVRISHSLKDCVVLQDTFFNIAERSAVNTEPCSVSLKQNTRLSTINGIYMLAARVRLEKFTEIGPNKGVVKLQGGKLG
ncbi:uncharacterized protein LOC143195983 [Rhynchophorus ferrugineus]|uniref:uncharacterized protein LOC143195983 n=1 Tax=Rhynchophorus ferrugineus TaxID=354439 RepID=UPI003FCD1FB4